MKSLNLLKTLLDLFFFFAVFTLVGMFIFFGVGLSDETFTARISGQEITISGWPEKALLVFTAISGCCFIYAMYLFRAAVRLFVKMQLFSLEVSTYFHKIGWLLIISTLLSHLPLFFYNMIRKNTVGIDFEIGGLDSGIISICLGLFFIVLSQVFRIARNLKEENDLTI